MSKEKKPKEERKGRIITEREQLLASRSVWAVSRCRLP